jgi:type I restriction enzyme M protein
MTATNHLKELENRLWNAADNLRANSGLRSSEYSTPVLGLIFLKYADQRFGQAKARLEAEYSSEEIEPLHYQDAGVLYLPDEARFSTLLHLPEDADLGKAVNDAMRAIEEENDELRDVLPKSYTRLTNSTIVSLLRALNAIPEGLEGDAFGKIYEYFLGEFAMAEGQRGGEFFTPTALVKLIAEIIEPYHGRIYDPASGSGGMFVQSAAFVARHQGNAASEISIYGQEKTAETVRLARMNLAIHALSGDIREGNTYYEDLHDSVGRFDFVMANPYFNVNGIEKEKLADDPRFPFGLPRVDNGNYIWIQIFYSALNERGRAGFVMANSASDARSSEQEIRRRLLEAQAVDVMIAIGPNMFYTVTLPCTLWFLDRGKAGTERADKVLFIDARAIYRQIDRAHRDFTAGQIDFLANIVRLYRGEQPEYTTDDRQLTTVHFPDGVYQDIPGVCKIATLAEIEAQGWSLNPGRYVGVAAREADDFDFAERLQELHEELERLNVEARLLEERISGNVNELLERIA